MKLPCKVIEDILPLYHDGVCSRESREIVEEHLQDCEACRSFLKKLDDDLTMPQESYDDMKPLQEIRSEWIKIKKKSLLKGALAAILAVFVLIGGYWGLTQWRFVPVSADTVEVTDICTLSDGTVAFHLSVNDGREFYRMPSSVDYDEGVAYITPRRAVIESQRQPFGLNDRYFYIELYPFTREYILDEANESEVSTYLETSAGYGDYSFSADVNKICIGTRNNNIVIWERGMELPAASEKLEELYVSGIR